MVISSTNYRSRQLIYIGITNCRDVSQDTTCERPQYSARMGFWSRFNINMHFRCNSGCTDECVNISWQACGINFKNINCSGGAIVGFVFNISVSSNSICTSVKTTNNRKRRTTFCENCAFTIHHRYGRHTATRTEFFRW